MLDKVQRKATRMIKGLDHHEERLHELKLWRLDRRWLGGDLVNVHKYLVGGNEEGGARLFSVIPRDKGRD